MNERIQELIPQAYDMVRKNHNGYFTQELLLGCMAELIVRECVAQIEIEKGNPYRNMGDIDSYGISACVESIRRIKEHFGVEE